MVNKKTGNRRECYYPECLQCCCTNGKDGDEHCQYETLIKVTNGPMNEVFRGALYGCLFVASLILIVSFLIYLWPNG
jgi:hypothetical protein